ncbi:MAG: HEPN domain-containing protein [Chloroflexi bacterium]|nr:HEPN domain-containing protein [Chloroflexota bacterium]
MHVLTEEWVHKAEGDFHTAGRELRARKMPNYDAVCFHCQQCAEKYLKAYLQERGQRFPRIHDLIECWNSVCLTTKRLSPSGII